MERLERTLQIISEHPRSRVILNETQGKTADEDCLEVKQVASLFDMQEMCKFFYQDHMAQRKHMYCIFENDMFLTSQDLDKDVTKAEQERITLQRMKELVKEQFFSVHDLVK